jgi:hypothetical protein
MSFSNVIQLLNYVFHLGMWNIFMCIFTISKHV